MIGALRTRGHGCRSAQRSIAITLLSRTSTPSRFLSSLPPPTSKIVSESSPLPDPPITRKVRVELRPSPVKLDATRPTNAHSLVPPKLDTPRVTPTTPSPSLSSADSVSETTKRDVEDAVGHGILSPPPPNASHVKRLLHQAWQLMKFYGRGLKMINTNRRHVAAIRSRIKTEGSPVTRWESRFLRTYREDARKLVPFLIIVVLLEEVIPLIAIYAPFMLPSTCILPSQRERIENAMRTKQASYLANNRQLFKHLSTAESGRVSFEVLTSNAVLAEVLCGALRLPTWGPHVIKSWRVRRRLLYISQDDELLAKEDMGAKLSPLEVTEALFERGIIAPHLSETKQTALLRQWLTSVIAPLNVDPVAKRIYAIARNASYIPH